MLVLYTFGPALGLPDPSPFVIKAEILLKLAGVPYQTNAAGMLALRRAPKGKLPFIEDEGELIADSTFIRWHLERRYGVDFDRELTPGQRAVAWSVERMLEDHLYWAIVAERWTHAGNFAKGPAEFFRIIPVPLRQLLQVLVRRKVAAGLWAQGLGRHSEAEIIALAERDLAALATIIGDKPCLMGQSPCGADATALAFLVGLLPPAFDSPLRAIVLQQPRLLGYIERLLQRFYPDHLGLLRTGA